MAAKGEGTIQAGEREVRVFFNNRALAQAEEATGKSIVALANGFSDGSVGIGDLAQLLRVGMDAARRELRLGGPAVRMTDAYEVLDWAGFAAVATAVMESVAAVLGYSAGDDDDGDGDPN